MQNSEIKVYLTDRVHVYRYNGKEVTPPEDWEFVPSGDPGLTRRLKAAGECWTVVHIRRNREEAIGLWTNAAMVRAVRHCLERERMNPAYQRKLAAARQAREEKENRYAVEFRNAVVKFLNFAPCYEKIAWYLADAVTDQAIPVGSGSVARTERIPVEQRAEAAVIAWMRHQTTAYDMMDIAPVHGERRDVRRRLAAGSRKILEKYRSGDPVDFKKCPLASALGVLDGKSGL